MSASTPSTTSQDDFAARLDRIRAKAGQHVLMVGQDEQVLIPRKERHQTTRSQEVAGNARYPASLVGAAFLGMAAVVAGHYVRFQMMTTMTTLQDPANEVGFVVVIGIALSFVLSQAFRLTSKLHRSLQGVGVFVMACMFHNLGHWLPGPMALAFSPEWVATANASSTPNSFRFGQTYYPLFAEQVVPTETDAAAPSGSEPPTCASALPKRLVLDGKTRKTAPVNPAPTGEADC